MQDNNEEDKNAIDEDLLSISWKNTIGLVSIATIVGICVALYYYLKDKSTQYIQYVIIGGLMFMWVLGITPMDLLTGRLKTVLDQKFEEVIPVEWLEENANIEEAIDYMNEIKFSDSNRTNRIGRKTRYYYYDLNKTSDYDKILAYMNKDSKNKDNIKYVDIDNISSWKSKISNNRKIQLINNFGGGSSTGISCSGVCLTNTELSDLGLQKKN